MSFELQNLVRGKIKTLTPYSSARNEFKGKASVFLDANENADGSPLPFDYNRYPDPLQRRIKEKLASLKGIADKHIFLGNGSDEIIDLLFRIFCNPGTDQALIFQPTYGMYKVCADINDVEIKESLLTASFQPDPEATWQTISQKTKLIFICSPNNPTGNSINRDFIRTILSRFHGLVILDEAYIDYADEPSFITELKQYPNLVVLQTLSKAWGLAGLRLGMAFASVSIIELLNKVKFPYNISSASQQLVSEALDHPEWVKEHVLMARKEKLILKEALLKLKEVETVFPSDANFLLVRIKNSREVYSKLVEKGIIVRDRSRVVLCDDCLRITVGTTEENKFLTETLQQI